MILGLVTGWGETLDPAQVSRAASRSSLPSPSIVRRVVHDIRKSVLARSARAA
jgi:hypothetical protein